MIAYYATFQLAKLLGESIGLSVKWSVTCIIVSRVFFLSLPLPTRARDLVNCVSGLVLSHLHLHCAKSMMMMMMMGENEKDFVERQ